MNPTPYNKPTSGGILPFTVASQQPLDVACGNMGKKIDLTGLVSGMLTVITPAASNGRTQWLCRCECGSMAVVPTICLMPRRGRRVTRSCGCLRKNIGERNTTHGLSRHPLYVIWIGMKRRCSDFRDARYGGRGISVCDEWVDDFMAFYNWSMANGYAKGFTIDRINNDGNYDPSNCRWVDMITQANNKRDNKQITAFGETKTLAQWGRDDRYNASSGTIWKRIYIGWSAESAISTPLYHKNTTRNE